MLLLLHFLSFLDGVQLPELADQFLGHVADILLPDAGGVIQDARNQQINVHAQGDRLTIILFYYNIPITHILIII